MDLSLIYSGQDNGPIVFVMMIAGMVKENSLFDDVFGFEQT